MPGFAVAGIGSPVADTIRPFYTYTWEIEHLLGRQVAGSVLVYAKDCTLPTFSTGREEVEGSSVVYKFASMVNWEDVRITFYDIPIYTVGEGGQYLAQQLKTWRSEVWNEERGIGHADSYKQESVITVFNLDQSVGYKWRLFGSWPQTVRDGDLTYTRTDSKLVEVVIVYDWAEVETVSDGYFPESEGSRRPPDTDPPRRPPSLPDS